MVKALQGATDCRVKNLMKSVNYDYDDSQKDCNKLIPKRLSVSKKNIDINTVINLRKRFMSVNRLSLNLFK